MCHTQKNKKATHPLFGHDMSLHNKITTEPALYFALMYGAFLAEQNQNPYEIVAVNEKND